MSETDQLLEESNILSSSLLVGLFNQITDDRTLVVLDMGLASPASVNFFGQTKCRLQYAGLIESNIESYNDSELSHNERVTLFKQALNLETNIKIDIILFWDLFCYLSAPTIAAILEALIPSLHAKPKPTALAYSMRARRCFMQSMVLTPLISCGSNRLAPHSLEYILILGMILADY